MLKQFDGVSLNMEMFLIDYDGQKELMNRQRLPKKIRVTASVEQRNEAWFKSHE
jgi:hypothetical protein